MVGTSSLQQARRIGADGGSRVIRDTEIGLKRLQGQDTANDAGLVHSISICHSPRISCYFFTSGAPQVGGREEGDGVPEGEAETRARV
jgi:hypothetical protein